MTLTITGAAPLVRRNFPGVLLSGTIGAAAAFLGSHYGAPVMLFALLLGIAFNFLADDAACRPGIDLSSKFLLRLGIPLTLLRIEYNQSRVHQIAHRPKPVTFRHARLQIDVRK